MGCRAGGGTGEDSALSADAEVVEKPAKEETVVENATPDYAAGLVSTQVGLRPRWPVCPPAPHAPSCALPLVPGVATQRALWVAAPAGGPDGGHRVCSLGGSLASLLTAVPRFPLCPVEAAVPALRVGGRGRGRALAVGPSLGRSAATRPAAWESGPRGPCACCAWVQGHGRGLEGGPGATAVSGQWLSFFLSRGCSLISCNEGVFPSSLALW